MSLEDGLTVDRITTLVGSMGVPSLDDFPPSALAYIPVSTQQYARRNVRQARSELIGALNGFFVPKEDERDELLWKWLQHQGRALKYTTCISSLNFRTGMPHAQTRRQIC